MADKMATTYNFNFNNKEEAIKAFRSTPLGALKELRVMLNDIELALNDAIEAKELSRYNEMCTEVVDLLMEMKELNPYKNYFLPWGDDEICININDIIDLF